MASLQYSAVREYSYKDSSSNNFVDPIDDSARGTDDSERITSAFSSSPSLGLSNLMTTADTACTTPASLTSDFIEYQNVGSDGSQIRGYKKIFTSSSTTTKSSRYGSNGSLPSVEAAKLSSSPSPARSSSSMSKLEVEEQSKHNHHHQHGVDCSHEHEPLPQRYSSSSSGDRQTSAKYGYTKESQGYISSSSANSRMSTPAPVAPARKVKFSDQKKEITDIDFSDILPDPELDKDISLYSSEKSTTKTQRRIKMDEDEKFAYSDFAMIPPSAARSPLPARKTEVRNRSPSPCIDPRSPSPVHQLTVPSPKSVEVRTPSPKDTIEADHHNCKYHSHHLDYKYTPPPVKGPCIACGQYIVGSLVTAMDQMWHPECFTCVNCDTILKSHNYEVEDEKPYCKDCHLRLFGPPCSVCHKPTKPNRYNLLNRIWHPECFCCVECGKRLTPDNFIERLGSPYCKEDYHRLFSPKCCVCHLPIKDKAINALNKMWHPHCFKCTHCGIPLEERNFYEKNGLPYCEKDFMDLFHPKCWGCKKPITDGRQMLAMGKPWHPECFRCTVCVKPLTPETFKEKDGKPYCEKDYHNLFSPKCAGCKAPITDGNQIYNKGKYWHPDCDAAINRQPPPPPPIIQAPYPQPPIAMTAPMPELDIESLLAPLTKTEQPKPVYAAAPPPIQAKPIGPPCYGCQIPIDDEKFITAMGQNYHPNCFKCTECVKPLNPYNFYEKNGLPYCEDDYHKLFSPKCAGCKTPIKDNNYIRAMGKDWHPNCFQCDKCKIPLNPDNFYEKNGRPYCENDYHKLFSPKCHGCSKPIKGKPLHAMGKDWHPECFNCDKCHIPLTPDNFFEVNGRPYCENDYHKLFSPKCHGCSKPIKGKPLHAMGKEWHPECFNCDKCHIPLSPDNFFEKNGRPYCENDFHKLFSPKCHGCSKPIKGKPLRAMGKEWHPECFNCDKCHIPLSPDNFYEKDGRPYCENDYHRLFSPKCCACAKPIKERPVFALGKEWHPKCFVCSHPRCDRVLDPDNFETHDNKPYCKDHFQEMFLPKCFACKKPITDKVVSALGKTWHPECFACVQCNTPLDLNSFREKDGLPYCEADYHALFSPKCAACEAPIVDKCLTALGKTWHPEHFTCHHCNKQMSDDPEGYHEHDGKGYCRPCYVELFAPYCRGCNKPIVDKICVTALNSKYHQDCFVCRDCSCPLKNGNYFEFEGEPYCEEHFRCKMCPDCVRLRRAQNKYFGTLDGQQKPMPSGSDHQHHLQQQQQQKIPVMANGTAAGHQHHASIRLGA